MQDWIHQNTLTLSLSPVLDLSLSSFPDLSLAHSLNLYECISFCMNRNVICTNDWFTFKIQTICIICRIYNWKVWTRNSNIQNTIIWCNELVLNRIRFSVSSCNICYTRTKQGYGYSILIQHSYLICIRYSKLNQTTIRSRKKDTEKYEKSQCCELFASTHQIYQCIHWMNTIFVQKCCQHRIW